MTCPVNIKQIYRIAFDKMLLYPLKSAVDDYNSLKNAIPVKLEFHPLATGYGEHLFNEICRDIISADIVVFDTSDLNPNVMREMGVVLTWGV